MIGIDSMVLIYAGVVPRKPGKTTEASRELQIRSKILLHMCRKDIIVLPTIAISEVLAPVPTNQRGALLSELAQLYLCSPFDLRAADIAAGILSEYKKSPGGSQYKRHVLRADAMIVATAKSAGAKDFYSHDKKCRALADLVMTGRDLPTRDPNNMFLEHELRRGDI